MNSIQERPPLVLTWYWPSNCGERCSCNVYRVGNRIIPDYEVDTQAKRLTDTELAAEVLSAIFHEAECEVRGLRLIIRDEAHPDIDHYAKYNHEFGRQATILERFATQPHYDEVQP